jgi:hypothetical protein
LSLRNVSPMSHITLHVMRKCWIKSYHVQMEPFVLEWTFNQFLCNLVTMSILGNISNFTFFCSLFLVLTYWTGVCFIQFFSVNFFSSSPFYKEFDILLIIVLLWCYQCPYCTWNEL